MRKLIYFMAALALLLGMLPSTIAFAADTGTSSGSFQAANVAPTISSVVLWTTGGSPATTTAMTPQVEYNVKVTVSDANTLADLSTVKVTIFYQATTPTFPTDVPSSGNTTAAAILTATPGTSSWAIDGVSGGGSWSIVSGSCVLPTLTGSTGTFEFHFKPGKVATAATGKWYIYAKATDAAAATGDAHQDTLDMAWYGEVTALTASVNWGSVTPGTGFAAGTNNQTGISATYIANGNYKTQVKSGATWTGASNNATFDNDGSASTANHFSLKAYYTDTFGSAVQVTTTGADVDSTGTQTAEAGNTVATNTLWLKLASVFPRDTYTGSIYYVIASR